MSQIHCDNGLLPEEGHEKRLVALDIQDIARGTSYDFPDRAADTSPKIFDCKAHEIRPVELAGSRIRKESPLDRHIDSRIPLRLVTIPDARQENHELRSAQQSAANGTDRGLRARRSQPPWAVR